MPADVIKRVNHMTHKRYPGILFADHHNVCGVIPHIPLSLDPNSTLPVSTTIVVDVPSDDDSTDDDYDVQADNNAFSNSSIDNTIIFDAASPNHNDDDKITGVDQNNNNDIIFPMHAVDDVDVIPGVDIPRVEIPRPSRGFIFCAHIRRKNMIAHTKSS